MVGSAAAQVGKIAGKVTDAKSGEPLPYANVVIVGTQLGAASDLDGQFFIINVPIGSYEVRATILGYTQKTVKGVAVSSDHTTRVEFTLEPAVLTGEEVSVIYEKPPVDLQETSVRSTVTQQTIEELPVQTVNQILELQAGASTDAAGELHLRGGRAGEIIYYVDGQRIEDPITGKSNLFVNREDIAELTMLSGTYNAEYGDAMSGIVQIITREGGDKLSAHVEYLSPMLNPSPYRKTDWVRSNSDAVRDTTTGNSLYQAPSVLDQPVNILPMQGRMQLSIDGPLRPLPRTTFFVSSLVRNENSYLPFGFEQENSLQGKVAWSDGYGGKLSLSSGFGWQNYQVYSHTWKYVPEHDHKHFLRDQRWQLQWSRSLSRKFFYELTAGYYEQRHNIKIFENWQDYIEAGYQKRDFTFAQYFYDQGDWSDTWRESKTSTYSVTGSFNYQFGNYHLLKGGVEGRLLDIEMLDIRELDIGPNNEQIGIVDRYSEDPIELAAYLQDKIELPYLVVNAGLRWDYSNPRSQGWSNPESPDSSLVNTPTFQQFSPRLGLAHPISDHLSLYFAYGHFFQYPHYENLFMNSADLNPDTLAQRSFDAVGNRSLKPQRTVAYETGLKGNLADNTGFSLTAFYKDITDLVGTKQVRIGTQYNYAIMRNIDYASVKGLEFSLSRSLANHWTMEGNYTYSVAKGNSSEPLQGFWSVYYQLPMARQEYFLDFDRRHVLNAMLVWQSRASQDKNSLLNHLPEMTLGVTGSWASGLPYTPYTGAGEQLAVTNSARMDATVKVDLRASIVLNAKPVKITLLTTVDNLFNFTNDLVVNSETGQPWDTPLEGNAITFDSSHDPSRVDNPRIIKIGLAAEY